MSVVGLLSIAASALLPGQALVGHSPAALQRTRPSQLCATEHAAAILRRSRAPRMAVAAETSSTPATTQDMSFNNSWYAVSTSSQLVTDEVFATRLWGEPLVLYRDSDGEPVCVRDVCPHRSAPLSMGELENGELRCFYHGWQFGKGGSCTDVPTVRIIAGEEKPNFKAFGCTAYSVVEHGGMVWVWKGHALTADVAKLPPLPSAANAAGTLTIDTTLDYGVAWARVLESNLAAPHLHTLLDGEGPSLAALGSETPRRVKLPREQATRRFAAPNVVRHTAASGCAEEVHVVPISQQRTRVLLRQHFKLDGALGALLKLPGALPVLTGLVRKWNYAVGLADMDAAAATDDDEAVASFREWHASAGGAESQYFRRWGDREAYADALGKQQVDGMVVGNEAGRTVGLKKDYVQDNPSPAYAPLRR